MFLTFYTCKVLPQSGIVLYSFNFVIKFSLLVLNFEVGGGGGGGGELVS